MMLRCRFLLACLLATLLMQAHGASLIVGHFPFWSAYSHGTMVADAPVERLTHLVYGVAMLNDTGEVVLADAFTDLVKRYEGADNHIYHGNFAMFPLLRKRNPNLRIVLSIGGWDRSQHFSVVAADAVKRQRFINTASALLDRYGFDGVELDWRFPVIGGLPGNSKSQDDLKNFRLLLSEFRQAFDRSRDKSRQLAITMGPASEQRAGWPYADMVKDVDFATLIATEFNGVWSEKTGHKAPLFADPLRPEPSVAGVVQEILHGGVPPAKLVLMVPTVGVSWLGVAPGNHGLRQPFQRMSIGVSDSELSKASGTFTLSEILRLEAGGDYLRQWDAIAQAETLYHPKNAQLISFESRRSLAAKLAFADREHLAGIALWYLSADAQGADSLTDQVHQHAYPWKNRWLKLRAGVQQSLPWLLGAAGGLAMALLLLAALWWLYRKRQSDEDAKHQALAGALQTLPGQLYIAASEIAAARAYLADRMAPLHLERLDEMAAASMALRQQLLPLSPTSAPVIPSPAPIATPAAAPAPASTSRDALLSLERFTREIAGERSLEKMIETMMQFLSGDDRVRDVVLQEDVAKSSDAGDGDEVLALNATRAEAVIEHEMLADYRLTLNFHAPLTEEDEVYFRSLANQIVLIRQQLQEVARQPQLLAELYEVAKRRDKLHFIRAERGYSGIHAADCDTPVYITLRLRALRLYFAELVPVHRSYLVRPQAVSGCRKVAGGGVELIVGGKNVPVARTALAKLKQQYPSWFTVE